MGKELKAVRFSKKNVESELLEVVNSFCYSFLAFLACSKHIGACVGGGIGLSNSFSSVLPFSFPTS